MKKITLLIALFITLLSFGQREYTLDTLQYKGHEETKYNLVIVAEGYTESQMDVFKVDAQNAKEAFFENDIYKVNEDYINIFAIHTISEESGISLIASNPSSTDPIKVSDLKNTAFGVYFQNSFRAHFFDDKKTLVKARQIAAEHLPFADVVLILVNDPDHSSGRASNTESVAIATKYKGSNWEKYVIIHELAHAMLGLGDAYADYRQENFNKTINNDPETIRWKKHLASPEVGIYEVKPNSDIYVPSQTCTMKGVNHRYLCPVCSERATNHFSTPRHQKIMPPHRVYRLEHAEGLLKLGWEPIPGATNYEVSVQVGVNDKSVFETTSTNEITINSPLITADFGNWTIDIRAYNEVHSSRFMDYRVYGNRNTPKEYPTPTNIQVTGIESNSFKLAWSKDSNAIFSKIRLFNSTGAFTEILTYNDEFVFNGLKEDETYFVQIAAEVEGTDSEAYNFYNSAFTSLKEVKLATTLSVTNTTKKEVQIYPNPVTSILNIKGLTETKDYKFFNVIGKQVQEGRLDSSNTISVDGLATGLYIIQFKGLKSVKFLKL